MALSTTSGTILMILTDAIVVTVEKADYLAPKWLSSTIRTPELVDRSDLSN
jgi:hypothetical protein